MFVLERLLLTMADKAGTKDLITRVNKAKSCQVGSNIKSKSKRKWVFLVYFWFYKLWYKVCSYQCGSNCFVVHSLCNGHMCVSAEKQDNICLCSIIIFSDMTDALLTNNWWWLCVYPFFSLLDWTVLADYVRNQCLKLWIFLVNETQKIKAITVCIYYPAIQAMAGWNPDSQRWNNGTIV